MFWNIVSPRGLLNRVRYGKILGASEDVVLSAESRFYSSFLSEGMTVFDVGANVGNLTAQFTLLVGSGRVHAFEANAETFAKLANRCETSGWTNVALNKLAVSDRNETLLLNVYDEDHSSWNTLADRHHGRSGFVLRPLRKESVMGITVDSYCEQHQIDLIDLLKIDVEGAELQVLLGARTMLSSRRIRCCTFEFGGTTFDMGNKPDDINNYLAGLGYSIRNIVPGDPTFPGRQAAEVARFSMHVAEPLP